MNRPLLTRARSQALRHSEHYRRWLPSNDCCHQCKPVPFATAFRQARRDAEYMAWLRGYDARPGEAVAMLDAIIAEAV